MTNQHQSFLERVKFFGLRKLYYLLDNSSASLGQSLIKHHISETLINVYDGDEGHNIDRKRLFLGFGLIHYAFIHNLRPNNILCVGSRMGFIPAILALACRDNGKGHVDFVDAGYDRNNHAKHWSGIGFWKKNDPAKHFAKIGVSDYITSYIMTTKEYAQQNPKKRYQYVYIDGDHSYDGVTFDYKLFWPRLDRGNFMSFHDVVAHGYLDKGLFGVWRLWKEIGNKHAIIFPFPKDSGLGIIQKI